MTFRTTMVLGLLVISLGQGIAKAQAPYVNLEQRLTAEQWQATGLATLSSAQLELLNRLLHESTAPTSAAVSSSDGTSTGIAVTPTPAILIGLDESPVRSRVIGAVDGWQPGTVFQLENGEQWKVLKGSMKLPKTLASPAVEVVAGVAGRWFFQVDENLPKARVYRIQ